MKLSRKNFDFCLRCVFIIFFGLTIMIILAAFSDFNETNGNRFSHSTIYIKTQKSQNIRSVDVLCNYINTGKTFTFNSIPLQNSSPHDDCILWHCVVTANNYLGIEPDDFVFNVITLNNSNEREVHEKNILIKKGCGGIAFVPMFSNIELIPVNKNILVNYMIMLDCKKKINECMPITGSEIAIQYTTDNWKTTNVHKTTYKPKVSVSTDNKLLINNPNIFNVDVRIDEFEIAATTAPFVFEYVVSYEYLNSKGEKVVLYDNNFNKNYRKVINDFPNISDIVKEISGGANGEMFKMISGIFTEEEDESKEDEDLDIKFQDLFSTFQKMLKSKNS